MYLIGCDWLITQTGTSCFRRGFMKTWRIPRETYAKKRRKREMLETQFALPLAKRKRKRSVRSNHFLFRLPKKKSVISQREENFSSKRRKKRLLKLGVEIVRFVFSSFLEALSPSRLPFPPTIREIYTLLPLNRNKPASFQGRGGGGSRFSSFLCPFGQSLRACLNTLVAEQRPTLDPPPPLLLRTIWKG